MFLCDTKSLNLAGVSVLISSPVRGENHGTFSFHFFRDDLPQVTLGARIHARAGFILQRQKGNDKKKKEGCKGRLKSRCKEQGRTWSWSREAGCCQPCVVHTEEAGGKWAERIRKSEHKGVIAKQKGRWKERCYRQKGRCKFRGEETEEKIKQRMETLRRHRTENERGQGGIKTTEGLC